MNDIELLNRDPYLQPFEWFFKDLRWRINHLESWLSEGYGSLLKFAEAHKHFGLHLENGSWVLREWAPNASAIYLIGPFSNWQKEERFRLERQADGNWEGRFAAELLEHNQLYRLLVEWPGGSGERIPSFVRRAVQDQHTKIFSAQVWNPPTPYIWAHEKPFRSEDEPLLIYECHVGMALEDGRVGTYIEFRDHILPRIVKAGYNTIQLMAIQEHPYYGSFGYQVANFFAPSSRFGTPEELKSLIDTAHGYGLTVLLDLVHSHAVKNELEGISRFDGTTTQYFHAGQRGEHPVWDSRLFNYAKKEVLRFLLSNIRYWLEEYRFDGFRFDGVTSMCFFDHGIGREFMSYDDYFSPNLDREAVAYLGLANRLAHQLGAVTVAEDVSGLPGLAAPQEHGGVGFDYRLAMGIPEFWVRTVKRCQDEEWHVEGIFYELTNRRIDERTISYAESHDQALVGDQTLIFRLLGTHMYDSMRVDQSNLHVDRGIALHRLVRLATISMAGHGYLNFMGNEFGHPEWIDFPREGNGWSYHHARRLWSLADNSELQYHRLGEFDRAMIELVKHFSLLKKQIIVPRYFHVENQVLAFQRGELIFIYNFNPTRSFSDLPIEVDEGSYELVLDSDRWEFGGHNRVQRDQRFFSHINYDDGRFGQRIKVYLPTRTALVLKKME